MTMDEVQDRGHNFSGTRVLIVGLAREGTALARFLVERGARVAVTDVKPAEALADSVAALAGLPIDYALGGHPDRLLDEAQVVYVSPGVPLEIPFLREARRRGLPLSSETRLFTRLCPALVVGVTGSSGKSTTTALLGEMLRAAGWKTWVGGNIGRPLIGQVDEIGPDDVVVMELSSFQLDLFAPWTGSETAQAGGQPAGVLFDAAGWSPPVAAVLNLTPNHLDRHQTMEAYIAAKAHILSHQRPGDAAVLNADDPLTRQMEGLVAQTSRSALWFSLEREVEEGAYLRDDELVLRIGGQEYRLSRTEEVRLLGRHNLANALAACVLAGAVWRVAGGGVGPAQLPVEALRQTVTSFSGVLHRLELVRERDSVRWYNDSIATTPARAVAALESFEAPIVLLAGGRDKHLPWDEMACLAWHKVRHLVLFGEAAGLIEAAMQAAEGAARSSPYPTRIHQAGTLEGAVELAARLATAGDVVLLSPGGTSFDAYADFVQRGDHFRQLVRSLE